jgi:hypothetical protein
MRLSFCIGLAACVSVAGAFGCSSDAAGVPTEPVKGASGVNATIAFKDAGTLKLAPREFASISVRTAPPDSYDIGFRLVGESLDASLDRSSTVSEQSSGEASATLRAPNQAATFAVRATIKDGPSADLVVSVSEQGYATLDVHPAYDGTRPVEKWIASAAAGTTCDALAATLPKDPDGALTAQAAPAQPLLIKDAPVGPALAVVVRAGHYAWGCTDVTGLGAGSTSLVEIHVNDRPLDIGQSVLDLGLEFAPEVGVWQGIVAETGPFMVEPFSAVQGGQPKALLEAMAEVAADPAAFKSAATAGGWLTKLQDHWTAGKIDVVAWLDTQIAAGAAPGAQVIGRVKSIGDAKHALFTLGAIGPLSAADAGVPTDYVLTLGIDPDDTVHLAGTLYLLPSRYLGATVSVAALAAAPDKKSVPEVLAAMVGCDSLGISGWANCSGECVAKTCRAAIDWQWQHALEASADHGVSGALAANASGAASFDDAAMVTGFTGSWLGQLSTGKVMAKLKGVATAKLADNPPPPM